MLKNENKKKNKTNDWVITEEKPVSACESEINTNEEFNIENDELMSSLNENKNDYLPEHIVYLDKESIWCKSYNAKQFEKGIDEMSEIAGKIAALTNVGITPSMALNFISENMLTDKTLKSNKEISELNAETTIACSKNSQIALEKTQL